MLIDIYTLAGERSAAMVERFLSRYLPHRQRADGDYTVTLSRGNDPAAVLDTPEELAAYCESHREADARAYWNNCKAGDPHSAHVFYLPDGGLVLGLSVVTRDEANWARWLDDMMAFSGAEHGYWTGNCPPEDTSSEFVAVARQARPDRRGT